MDIRGKEKACLGHRHRLRTKFLKSGLDGFHDYEVIELLLTLGTPRKDCKIQAKALLAKFKSLRGVLDAEPDELQKVKGIGPNNYFGIKLFQEVSRQYLKSHIIQKRFCRSARDVSDYFKQTMRGLKKEVFKVLFLDGANRITGEEEIARGTVNASCVFPREVMESALRNKAAALIFLHNHPSGNEQPSNEDKTVTQDLKSAAQVLQIKVLDHIIIGNQKCFSFAEAGLI